MPEIEYFFDVEQGSEEWHSLRAGELGMGSFGSSEAQTVAGKGKGREKLLREKMIFISTGFKEKSFENGWMRRGKNKEREAAKVLEEILAEKYASAGLHFNGLLSVGMVRNPEYPGVHDSPDSLVDSNDTPLAPIEIKTLSPSVHNKNHDKWVKSRGGWVATDHKWQCDTHRVINNSFMWYFCYDDINGMHILSKLPHPSDSTVNKIASIAKRWRNDWRNTLSRKEEIILEYQRSLDAKYQELSSMKKISAKKLREVSI
jgi:hypothetical protein